MIVNIHDGPWQCATCRLVYTRHVGRCDTCGGVSIVHCSLKVAWGDDVTAICQGLVAIQGDGKRDQEKTLQDLQREADVTAQAMLDKMARDQDRARAQAKPCQPDPFPMQQSAALSAILESWPLHPTGDYLSTHIDHIAQNVGKLCEVATVIAQQLEKNRKTVERF